MKKTLLLLVAAVLALGLVISCAQPSSFEVTLTPGSAEAVSTESIKYDVLPGYNLVQWDGANDGSGYGIYRKTVDADNNPVDASILALNNGSQTNTLKLWYYQDTAVKDGEKYQYGIVTTSYKDSGNDVVVKSEIAWQAETETSKYAAANVPAKGTKYSLPATLPEATITLVNTSIPGTSGWLDVADQAVLTISKLDLNYTYKLGIQTSTSSGTPETSYTGGFTLNSGNDIWGGNAAARISNYLENGTTIILSGITTGYADTTTLTAYDTYAKRLVVQIDTADDNGFIEVTTPAATEVLSSNEKVLGTIAKK
jgi:hypothetical protein